ncbi:MAG: L,D-transpeptidase family protein [Gammaproteobacteria bacterium]
MKKPRHRRHPTAALPGFVCLLLCLTLTQPAATASPAYHIEISKSQRVLQLKQAETIIKQYHIAYGKGGDGTKKRSGDNKTPLGHYKVVEFKADSKFHFFILLNYPNLLDAWHGYQDQVINAAEFRDIASAHKFEESPPQDTGLGGYIGIHGIGKATKEKLDIHQEHNWTEGCIAMRNNEITELRKMVTIGMPVTITE